MLKTPGLPIWVTIFALVVLAFGSLGVVACFGDGMEGMTSAMSISWGGRHLGLGLAAGMAVLLKSPAAYMAAFVGGLGRDAGDLVGELSKADHNLGIVVFLIVFLILGALAIYTANKARTAGA